MSIIAEIVTFGKENISTFAICWAKHSESVCKKYYIQHFSQREAGRILRSCYSMYKTRADPKKVVKMREKVITKADMDRPKNYIFRCYFI